MVSKLVPRQVGIPKYWLRLYRIHGVKDSVAMLVKMPILFPSESKFS